MRPRLAAVWITAFAVFTVVCAGLWGWFVWHDRAATLDKELTRAAFEARVLEDHAERAIVASDRVLTRVVDMIVAWDRPDAAAGRDIEARMLALTGEDSQIGSAWVLDAAGRVILGGVDRPPSASSFAHRDYFRAHLGAERGLFIGAAEIGAFTRKSRFTLSRAVRHADGRLRAVAVVGLSSDYFSTLYSVARFGPRSGIGVFSRPQGMLAQSPTGDPFSLAGLDLSQVKASASGLRSGAYIAKVGGERRVVAYSNVNDPVMVVATSAISDVLQGWRTRTWQSGSVLLAAIIAFGIVVALGMRLAGREAGALAELSEANARLDDRVRDRTATLAESVERYRALTEAAAAVVWTAPADGRADDIPQWRTITGQTVGQVKGLGWLDAVHSDERAFARAAWEHAVATRTIFDFEHRVRGKDGRYRWYHSRGIPILNAGGSIREWVGVFIDIDERKRAEDELRARTAELETIMETVPAVVFRVHGREANYITFSRHGQELLRSRPGPNLSRMVPTEGAPAPFVARKGGVPVPPQDLPLHRAARGEEVHGEDIEVVLDDGSSVTLLMHATPLYDVDGEPIGAVGAAIDITERKRTEDRQNLIMAELDHRVRNTLASIRSILTLAEKSAQSKEEFADGVRGRVDAMARAHGLLTNTQWRGANLRRLVVDELQPYVVGDPGRLRIAGSDLLLQPKAAVLIALVIHELATNAAKYGALSVPLGTVSIAWRIDRADDDRRLHLTWTESGGPSVATPSRRGFGALLIENSLAQEFDAETRLDFAPGGVAFGATIPLARIAAGDREPTGEDQAAPIVPRPHAIGLSGVRVLLVEDDALIALDMKDGLEEAGATIVGPVARLDRALLLAADDGLDAAVLDVNLGGEQVFPLADLLAERSIPFAFLTGYHRRAVFPDRYRDALALQKPVSRFALTAIVERLMRDQARAAS